jgi:hypothetical protein
VKSQLAAYLNQQEKNKLPNFMAESNSGGGNIAESFLAHSAILGTFGDMGRKIYYLFKKFKTRRRWKLRHM